MPKDTDEEKAARSAAIQEATTYAAQVPLEVARRACRLIAWPCSPPATPSSPPC